MAERRRIFTKVELLALELLIAVAQEKGVAPSSGLKDDTNKVTALTDVVRERWEARGGFSKINEKVLNPRIKSAVSNLGPEPTLKELMELHAEAVKNVK